MKTVARLSLVLAAAVVMSVGSIACTAAPDQSFPGDRDDDNTSAGDKDDKKPAATAKAETTPPPSTTPPPVTAPDASTVPPTDDPEEACFLQCIAVDAAAKQIDDQFMACLDGCQDLQCEKTCDQAASQACQGNPTACQKLQQCGDQCFTDGF